MDSRLQVRRFVAAVAALALLGLASIAAAQTGTTPATTTGTVTGTVSDNAGAHLANVTVRLDGTPYHAGTDENGRFTLTGVPPGSYVARALIPGYKQVTQNVTVAAGGTVDLSFQLAPAPIQLEQMEIVVGSRARHTAADELAVPVDVYDAKQIARQGTTETSQAIQQLSPSVNFPHQSVTDATDIVRPFTLRGLSPDQTLVLMNGLRRHQTALVNTFAYGMPAGSSGVDLNAIPSSAIDRVEVLRDGASAQYGSDAIAGVVNIVTRTGRFAPFVNITGGQYTTGDYSVDGKTFNANAGWGLELGRGSLGLFFETLDREPTNRAWADPFDTSGTGIADSVSADGKVVVKRSGVQQPNYHWGDGLERDYLSLANWRMPLNDPGTSQLYAFGGYSFRHGTGQGYRRYEGDARNWPEIYPLGFLPQFSPDVTDYSAAGGWLAEAGGWRTDIGASFGHNDFKYDLSNTLNASLGPSLTTADNLVGIPNQTSFDAGRMNRDELVGSVNATTSRRMLGLPDSVSLSVGAAYRYEKFAIHEGELASYVDGGHLAQDSTDAPGGSQVFPGFSPRDASNNSRTNTGVYADLETRLGPQVLADLAGRYEHYSDFGGLMTGKFALRYQPTSRLVFRGAVSNGFRAPGLGQIHFSKVVTNFIGGTPEEIGIYPVDHPAAVALGSKPLKEETSLNFSGGVAVTPIERLTFTADYFNIKIDNRIILGATFDDDTVKAILARDGFTGIGGVQYFTNGLDTRTQGVDFTADWHVPMHGRSALNVIAAVNYTKNEITHVDPLPAVLSQSTESGLLDVVTRVAIEKERPDWRTTLTGDYTLDKVHALARISYYGKFSSAQPGYCDACEESYGAKTLVDLEGGYQFPMIDWTVGARNLFDTYPDHPKLDFNNNFGTFPWAAASPFGYNGRYLYTKVSFVGPSR